ncbi:MAG: hypothetical protein ABFR05_10385, partial [Bacteroidota bacterium]
MKKTLLSLASVLFLTIGTAVAQENQNQEASSNRIAEFVHWYPAIEQAKMRDDWLKSNKYGEWQFTGMV